jgi:Domain of unknown function (DU1801)
MANKTVETAADVAVFVAAIADEGQRADAETLIAMMAAASGEPPALWGPSIIGFGRAHYRYESGREGDMPRIAFSPRKGQMVIYLADDFPDRAELIAQLGPHKTGKACLYLKRLADADGGVLRELIMASLAESQRRNPPD